MENDFMFFTPTSATTSEDWIQRENQLRKYSQQYLARMLVVREQWIDTLIGEVSKLHDKLEELQEEINERNDSV